MSALKKIFGGGKGQDDDVMYKSEGTASTAIENQDRAIQSERDMKPGAAGQAEEGVTSSNVTSQTAGTAAATTAAAGTAAAGTAAAGTAAASGPDYTRNNAASPANAKTIANPAASSAADPPGSSPSAKPPQTSSTAASPSNATTVGAAATTGAVAGGAAASGLSYASWHRPGSSYSQDGPPVVGGSMADSSAYMKGSDNNAVSGTAAGAPAEASGLTYARSFQSGYPTEPKNAAPPVVGGSMANSSAYMAGSAATPGAGSTSAQQDDTRGISAGRNVDPKEDEIAKATYTERSYQLASGDASGSHSSGEAAAAAGVFGATIVGAGAYAAASRNDDKPATTTAADELHPDQADSSGRIAPGHIPGEFPSEGVEPQPGRGVAAGAAVGALAAGGAGGAAMSTYDQTSGGVQGFERQRFYGRPPSSPPVSPPQSPEATQTAFKRDDLGRDAAIAGGVAAAGGAVAYGVHEATQQKAPVGDTTGRSVEEQRAREDATYPVKEQDHPHHHKHHHGHHHGHHKHQEEQAASEPEEPGDKKQGFFSKVFHGHDKSQEAPIGDAHSANEVQRVGQEAPTLGGSAPIPGGAGGEEGLIHLVRSDADPDAPALVVRETPGGGIETTEA